MVFHKKLGEFEAENINLLMNYVSEKLFTHDGSKELQDRLESDPILLPSIILQEVEKNVKIVCLDTYGNYVCQKLITYLSAFQLYRLITCLSEDFLEIVTSIPGSCVMASIISTAVKNENFNCKTALLFLLEKSVCQLICDPQGSHLLQQVVALYEKESVYFIIDTVIENFFTISTDRFGCCLVKKIIENHENIEIDNLIFSEVCSNLSSLTNVSLIINY